MSFNIREGGDGGGLPLRQTAAVIRAARADVVGLQETTGHAPKGRPSPDNSVKLARMLGWKHFDQGGGSGVITRFKILGSTPRKWGVKVAIESGRPVYVFNAHLRYFPYQPYQLLRIPYQGQPLLRTAAQAIDAAIEARGAQWSRMLAEARQVLPEQTPVFITGDFNEPSCLDWTPRAAQARACPIPVPWPATKAVVEAGFVDAYRQAHPDEVGTRGLTWTPITNETDPRDRHDRIDFVFGRGGTFTVKAAEVVGESQPHADIVVAPYPSDHRAVVATIEISDREPKARSARRHAWRYVSARGPGSFVHVREKQWRENTVDGTTWNFVEVDRTPECIELHDVSRDTRIRLFDDHCEILPKGASEWKRLYEGEWTDSTSPF
jgi:endonuclease/exonuclease/phosphatase family metal-dependent hydrolase